MKKISIIFSCVFINFLVFSCNPNEMFEKKEINELNDLADDPIFLNFLKLEKELFENMKNPKKIIELTRDREQLSDSQLNELSIAMGFDDSNGLINFYESQNDKILAFSNQYGVTSTNLTDLEGLIFSTLKSSDNTLNKIGGECDYRYNNCIIAALALATLEHIGCGLADLTVILGIICHSAVTALHVAETNKCEYEYQDCINN